MAYMVSYVLFIIDLPHSSSYDLPPAKRIKYEDSDGMCTCVCVIVTIPH